MAWQDKELAELELVQSQLDFEYQLNDGRLNAHLIFSGLLIAAVGFVLSAISTFPVWLTGVSIVAISILGIRLSKDAAKSMESGIKQIESLKKRREVLRRSLGDHSPYNMLPTADLKSDEHSDGVLPYRQSAKYLVWLWYLLIGGALVALVIAFL